jgi:hypothetical protein
MRHLQSLLLGEPQAKRRAQPAHGKRSTTPFRVNGWPKLCRGCGQSFPVRQGRTEAQLGRDGQLYCFDMTPECSVLAVQPDAICSAA